MFLDVGSVIGVVSAVTAIISLLFAYVTVKMSRQSNFASLVAELHNYYRSEAVFRATQAVWELYKKARFTEQEFQIFLKEFPRAEKLLKPFLLQDLGDQFIYVDVPSFTDDLKSKLAKLKNVDDIDALVILNKKNDDLTDIAEPVTKEFVKHIVENTDRKSALWQGLHNADVYWRYISLLVYKGMVDETIAWSFTSPKILGLLYPFADEIHKKALGSRARKNIFQKENLFLRRPLFWLYTRYKKWDKYNFPGKY